MVGRGLARRERRGMLPVEKGCIVEMYFKASCMTSVPHAYCCHDGSDHLSGFVTASPDLAPSLLSLASCSGPSGKCNACCVSDAED
jgi:hypothetical protein